MSDSSRIEKHGRNRLTIWMENGRDEGECRRQMWVCGWELHGGPEASSCIVGCVSNGDPDRLLSCSGIAILHPCHSPPYKLSCSSLNMSITSHSKTLFPTSPQLIPGMSLSVCICLNCLPSSRAAEDTPPDGLIPLRPAGDAMIASYAVWQTGPDFEAFEE